MKSDDFDFTIRCFLCLCMVHYPRKQLLNLWLDMKRYETLSAFNSIKSGRQETLQKHCMTNTSL